MIVERVEKNIWPMFSEEFHGLVFEGVRQRQWERVDFALLVRHSDVLLGYVTCKELDSKSVYWQYGGSFPGAKSNYRVYQAYQALIDYCRRRYERVGTLIENGNTAMLKIAMKAGFRIIGIRNFQGTILLEHCLEFNEVK